MRKISKIFKVLIISLCILFILTNFVEATGYISNFKGATGADLAGADTKIKRTLNMVLTVVRNIGAGLAALILMVLGCKYMLASAGERAEIKKHAVTYVIGAIVLFASSAILEIIKKFALNATA